MAGLEKPFLGSAALARGELSRHQLRTRYRAVYPDVYLRRVADAPLSLRQRTAAAWLWSHGDATIAGLAAAALHGTKWIDDDVDIELMHANPRPPKGITTRRDELLSGEAQLLGGRRVTTPARTAFDLGRSGDIDRGIARLDALTRATRMQVSEIEELARRHRGARGLRQLETALDLVDSGAESPKETWLRLLLIRDGLPRPRTQIPVADPDDDPFAFLDMGWDDRMVAAEYDGEHHQRSRWHYTKDIRRSERIARHGWIVVKVVKEDRPADILRRVRMARASRLTSVH